ncbi:hypothetical protein MIB92_11845 [Aestuariirhabdus sp. Z084]|uniref:hypothetical protein n=1 Tax=Aestuariirhabdus haliotis TaxID=2918751 RepID=UPI00201B428D|nr:hypothetical protein [Aestuariirhabdus haliotis]MCL6416344.1 hypothetical protein [Aestuariirhabdus haliotis]MCL6420333.1 hypothetical protein [Aestuariirhabdus haliotis]
MTMFNTALYNALQAIIDDDEYRLWHQGRARYWQVKMRMADERTNRPEDDALLEINQKAVDQEAQAFVERSEKWLGVDEWQRAG